MRRGVRSLSAAAVVVLAGLAILVGEAGEHLADVRAQTDDGFERRSTHDCEVAHT